MCGICKNESRNSLCYKCKKKIQKEFKFTKIHTKDKNFLEQYYISTKQLNIFYKIIKNIWKN